MNLLDLPYPTAEHFKQPFGGSLDRLLYITRGFLKPRYANSPSGETLAKNQYVSELIQQIEDYDIAFRKLVISNETLTEVAVSLHRDYTETEAERCLQEVRTSETFQVIQTSRERFDEAASHFESVRNKDPHFGEFIDYQVMQDENIQYVATWDTDFTSFGDISMYPISRWG